MANLYNHTYRQGKNSQYTFENVCIVPGGRAGLSRVAAVIGDVYTVSVVYHLATWPPYLTRRREVVPSSGLHRVRSSAERLQETRTRPYHVSVSHCQMCGRGLIRVGPSLDEEDNYHLNIEQTRKDIRSQGLQVIIASNPRNPTGQVIRDGELRDLVGLARETSTTLILDEVRARVSQTS